MDRLAGGVRDPDILSLRGQYLCRTAESGRLLRIPSAAFCAALRQAR
jgi:hypothetical protein